MFDRTLVMPTRTEYVTREVHEHRAPTDESVKLLREMEDKARAQVISSIPLEGNTLHGVVRFVRSFDTDMMRADVIVDINGKRLDVQVHQKNRQDQMDFYAAVRDELARKIATDVLVEAMRGMKL